MRKAFHMLLECTMKKKGNIYYDVDLCSSILWTMFMIIDIIFYVDILYFQSKHTICPRSRDPIHIVNYYLKWVTTAWTYNSCMILCITDFGIPSLCQFQMQGVRHHSQSTDSPPPPLSEHMYKCKMYVPEVLSNFIQRVARVWGHYLLWQTSNLSPQSLSFGFRLLRLVLTRKISQSTIIHESM